MEEHSVAMNTVRQAVSTLEADGLVESVHGVGCVVLEQRPTWRHVGVAVLQPRDLDFFAEELRLLHDEFAAARCDVVTRIVPELGETAERELLEWARRQDGVLLVGHVTVRVAETLARAHVPVLTMGEPSDGPCPSGVSMVNVDGFIRTKYHDTEDHGWMHVTFEDGTVGDVISGEIVLGGIYNYVEVFANNHRTRCNLSPVAMLDTYNPKAEQFKDIYTVEKTSTKEGWAAVSPDENITLGYIGEMQDFFNCIAAKRKPESDLDLAFDTISAIYAAYLSDEKKGAEVAIPLI